MKISSKTSQVWKKWNWPLKHLICHFSLRNFLRLASFSAVCGWIFKHKVRISLIRISAIQQRPKSWEKLAKKVQEWTLEQIHISYNFNYQKSTVPNLSPMNILSVLKYFRCYLSGKGLHIGHARPFQGLAFAQFGPPGHGTPKQSEKRYFQDIST